MSAVVQHAVRARRRPVDLDVLRGQVPSIDGTEELPVGSVIIDPATDRIVLAYLGFTPPADRELRTLAARVKVPVGARTLGVKARSLTFGSVPRLEVRGRDWCRSAQFNQEHPRLYSLLADTAVALEDTYESLAPGVFERHAEQAGTVIDEWRLPGSRVFTGGVLNRDSNIGYHFDSGNFRDVWSAMICLRRGMDGGALVLPELGLHLPIADNTVTLFDGQGLVHGVTPMRRTSRDGYRITCVFYSTARLWSCLPLGQEVERGQVKRTERALRRAGVIE